MKIEFDAEKLNAGEPIVIPSEFIATNMQYFEPAASVEGISVPDIPRSPLLVKLAITAAIAVGTISTTGGDRILAESPDVRIEVTLPDSEEWAFGAAALDKYSHLRATIERSGIPMLDDEALRAEVEARKGSRSEALPNT